ncbi:damage-inducible protein CinA [[Bacillus] enclensis]|uniref:Putative competence-damage inducible protein n=1 Tax=[Bacillus] enclensis TaxID=1402860 RepID=A0A0V8HJR2_9BACI|nr:competence/damage-inducible protein A [[Bacillus] enclensis]KSU62583.1 damage-inducible protein CinA [[Bacillus] enclensis]SCC06608.1 nicotinamide-nucleotide amidase [[Bacillus] enclensis]
MNAEIIAVGSELLLGQIANTNAQYISEQLAEAGVDVYYHTSVGDNPVRLSQAVKVAQGRADLLIFTGGLGPTKDDLTKETIAKALGTGLSMDGEALESIKAYFQKTKRQMTPNNEKQALILEGSASLKNENGMAPGMFLKKDGISYMLLPGPPSEMRPMFSKYGIPAILGTLKRKEIIYSRVLRFFGIGEAQLETDLEELIDTQTNPTIAPLAGDGEVTLRLTAKHESKSVAAELLDGVEEKILNVVGDYFYGYDQDSLVEVGMKVLKGKGLTLSCAESLTGGLFQSEITTLPGASAVLKGGVVCYQDEIKKKVLSVREDTLKQHSAVSEQCALELAENVRTLFASDIGISFTGVAGPDDLDGKKAGTVWIGLAVKDRPAKAFLLNLAGGRNGNRKRTAKYGWHYLLKELT